MIDLMFSANGIQLTSAIVGGAIGLLGIIFTIRFTRKQFKLDKRIEIKPYLDLSIDEISFYSSESFLTGFEIDEWKNEEIYLLKIMRDLPVKVKKGTLRVKFNLENIGLGNAIHLKLIDIISDDRKLENCKDNMNIIKKDSGLTIFMEIEKVIEEKVIEEKILELKERIKRDGKLHEESFKIDTKKYPYGKFIDDEISKISEEKIYITFEYEDMLYNKYKKTFCLQLYLFAFLEDIFTGLTYIECGLKILKEVEDEKLVKSKNKF